MGTAVDFWSHGGPHEQERETGSYLRLSRMAYGGEFRLRVTFVEARSPVLMMTNAQASVVMGLGLDGRGK